MLDLEHFLPYRLSVLSNRISEGIALTYRNRFGLSVTEWRAIAIVGRYPRISATEVAQRSAMDKVAVSRAVKNLLARGLLEREASDSDRRAKHLSLSREGQTVHDRIVPEARAFERRLLAALDPDDRAALDRAIDRLAAAAEPAHDHPAQNPPPETA
ncbi:MarR family transcriptional regulator [Wenzhouxiangella sp. XN79A]|uniref:MarR family winged helix-turn-helix transcriptional regulator n=1 Tax=Wenzhouxiangella sp. XN79A TaxID=2724193 RepID=UPI00144ADEC4|nr:MarR family transcriptional regulator [Wenzhouxiangella sp. XN79A]NKI35694.1 MarR family transcriptional regulator [Wenzhouxiangella sp. XN79A]